MGVGVQVSLRNLRTYTLLVGLLLLLAFFITKPASAAAGVNQQINFQGRLLTSQGATVPDGYYNIQFNIYQDGDGQTAGNTTGSPAGSLKWTETYLNANSQGVLVKNGFLSVQLGLVNPFGSSVDWNQDTLWLSMNVAGVGVACTPFASCSPDGEMVPMKRLSSTPYALNSGLLGGIASSQFLQIAKGLQTDATNVNSIYLNKTGTGNIVSLQSGGIDSFAITNSGDVAFGANANHTVTVATAGAGVAGKTLTISGGSAGAGDLAGGNLILQGGAGSGTGASGGVIVKANTTNTALTFQVQDISGNNLLNVNSVNKTTSLGNGSTQDVPNFKDPSTNTLGGTIASGNTYYYGITAVNGAFETELSPVVGVTIVSATNTNKVNLSWVPSYGATGYKIYRSSTNDFTTGSLLLTTIGSGATTTYSDTGTATSAGLPPATTYTASLLRVDAAATNPFGNSQSAQLGSMYYNTTSGEFQCYKDAGVGGTWADCGVTTMQGAYNNGAGSATVPAIKLDSEHSTINYQDGDVSIGTDLFDVRASNPTGLGAVMFGIGNTGMVSLQNSVDQNSAFRILNQGGQYLLNANTVSGYFITNTTRSLSNQAQNPSFEAGGSITSGEEGWNGPAQASIVNASADAHTGNYELQVTPNATSLKTYASTYYSVYSGDVVYFEGWTKNAGGTNGTAGVILEGYDKDKNYIGSVTDSGTLPGTSYIVKATSYTVPSNVAFVRAAAIVNASATTGTFYFDDFYLSSSQRGQQVFQNTTDSTTAFRIQSASAAQTLFTASTTDNILKIGDSTGTDTATTLLVLDAATANPSTSLASKNGGLFYRSDTSSLKAIVGGAVVDICTTAVTCSGYSASAASSIQLQATSPGVQQSGNFNITGTGMLTRLQTQDQTAASINSDALTIKTGNASGSTSNSGNLTIDVGTATGSLGTISIGHTGVATTMAGTLAIQSGNSLALGTSSAATGSILMKTAAGSHTVTILAPGTDPTASWNLVLPTNPGTAGDCLKESTGTGTLAYGSCSAGITVNLQDTYNNSSAPATVLLADNKNMVFTAQDTTTDSSMVFNLNCTTCSGGGGQFRIMNGASQVFTVMPNGGGIVLNEDTQIGSGTADATETLFKLDSSTSATDQATCGISTNQGAMYYSTATGSIRACLDGAWSDMSNPDTLGLLSFGIIPSSGAASGAYDLPSLVVPSVSGPCKASWSNATTVHIEACTAYSGGERVNVAATNLTTNSASAPNISLTAANRWGHICINASGVAAFTTTAGQATALAGLPTFSLTAPVLCLADVQGINGAGGTIDNIYDVRTFTSSIKEAVNATTAVELGMLTDASATGTMIPAANLSQKLYGLVVATNGSTSTTTPNIIVNTVGAGWVKANAGTAGSFVIASTTAGYATTNATIPNNSFYYSAGNTRTTYSTACTSAATCSGSLYVNFIVR